MTSISARYHILLSSCLVMSALVPMQKAVALNPIIANENCPTKANGHKWSKYFLGQYPGGRGPLLAGVDFVYAVQSKEKVDIGFNDPTSCYMVIYRPGGPAGPTGWHSHRDPKSPHYSSSRGPTAAEQASLNSAIQLMEGGPGDPNRMQISVSGTLFAFDDDTGEIKDKHGYKVAQLQCFFKYTPCGQ
jgi:hypothetical protein